MIEQQSQICKRIPLLHTAHQFEALTYNCPKRLQVENDQGSYFLNSVLYSKKQKNPLQGIFQQLQLNIIVRGTSNNPKESAFVCLVAELTPNNFNTFKNVGKHIVQQQKNGQYNQFVDFDLSAIRLMRAFRNQENFQFHLKEKIFTVLFEGQQWKFTLWWKRAFQGNLQQLSPASTRSLINSSQYLSRIQQQLYSPFRHPKPQHQHPLQPSSSPCSALLKQNLLYRQRIKEMQQKMDKNNQNLSNVIQELKAVQKQLYNHGQMIEVQENKIMGIVDQLKDMLEGQQKKKQEREHKKDLEKKEVTVPDFLREKLSIDLHSSFLNKFDISGSQITYIGQDKQATQLLSNRTFSHNRKPSHLHSSLFIRKTEAKCIKMGIIDSSYKKQRSCWNFPNIIYMHGWGHTMVNKHEQDHNYCDFGTGSKVEMEVDFSKGWVKWKIDGKREVKLGNKEVGSMLSSSVQWVPFIAMYNYMDSVQWVIGQ